MTCRLCKLLGTGVVVLAVSLVLSKVRAQSPSRPRAASSSQSPEGPDAAAEEATGTKDPNPAAPTVRIVFKLVPPNNATVAWGGKRLGVIKPKAPLIIERPRDSGPIDVVVKSAGYVTVHTRAYTFTNSVVAVKLTPLDKKNTIYGYREELPPEPDGGAAPLPPTDTSDAGAR